MNYIGTRHRNIPKKHIFAWCGDFCESFYKLKNGNFQENGELLFNGSGVLILQTKRILKMGNGDDNILWMYLILLKCTLKYG